jgi:hypothetical protein
LTTTLPSPATTCNFPELPYTPHTRKRSIAIAYSALILITCIQVEFFFLLRRFATSASLDTALTVPTALLLGFSTPAMLLRTWQLARRGSNVNPVSRRQYFVRPSTPMSRREFSHLIVRLLQLEHDNRIYHLNSRSLSRHCKNSSEYPPSCDAVDGGGGQEFREALLARHERREVFGGLVEQMN